MSCEAHIEVLNHLHSKSSHEDVAIVCVAQIRRPFVLTVQGLDSELISEIDEVNHHPTARCGCRLWKVIP